MSEGQGQEPSYRAFISYSHRDDVMARKLHRQLETYQLPKHLIGNETPRGMVPPRLTPIFRDLDELSAADDLSAEIKAALARSEVLVILASPAAKASKWVNLEIETFRALHGNSRPVLVALLEGEPADAFPPALTAGGTEPVAADFRREAGGGKRLAMLKLIAGISGAPLDSLVQRDAQRQLRRVTAITGGALAAALVMALLLFVALRAQADAERQRQEAEGLVDYMLTDLREQLKGVGSLKVMTAVNERAMKYYGGGSIKALLLQARTLHALGDDDEKRGNIALAHQKFDEAYEITNSVLTRYPKDTDALFAHAQSEYWLGYMAYNQRNRQLAIQKFNKYRDFIELFCKHSDDKPKCSIEMAYAFGNICGISLEEPVDLNEADNNCINHLKHMQIAYKYNPKKETIISDLLNAYAWVAQLYLIKNYNVSAENMRMKQFQILHRTIKNDPDNAALKLRYMISAISYSEILLLNKKTQNSVDKLKLAEKYYNELVKTDRSNMNWKSWKKRISKLREKTHVN